MAINTMKTPTAVWFQKKSCITADDVLSAVRLISPDMIGRFPIMVDQIRSQRQTRPQHSPWLISDYHGNRYNENTDHSSVSKEKLHHSR
jgi:hypothetical protein